jgi:hypothetical protein
MSERRELIFASSRASGKHCLWKRAGRDIGNMITDTNNRKIVKAEEFSSSEAEQDISLDELLGELALLARDETKPAVLYLKQLLSKLEGRRVIRSTFNKMLLKARIELKLDKKHTENLRIRATNALHLSGSELQIGKDFCFEASLVDDGIVLTGVTGLSVQISVLKGSFRCDVLQARVQVRDGKCRLRLKTRNPLIGQTDDDFSLVDLDTDVYCDPEKVEFENLQAQSNDKKQKAKRLRNTYTNMRAFGVSDKLIDTIVPPPASSDGTSFTGGLRLEYLKNLCSLYAVSLVLVSSYLFLMNHVPQAVPLIMILSAVSLLTMGFDKQWSLKSVLKVIALNAVSMIVVTIQLYLIS